MSTGRLLDKLWRSIRLLITKAVIESINDSGDLQVVKVALSNSEGLEDVERVQNFGLTSVPPEGAQAVLVLNKGERNHAICIAADAGAGADRPKNLSSGETCLYINNTTKIYLKASGEIDIESSGTVNIKSGDIKLGDGVLHRALMTEDIITKFNTHTHPTAPGGPVSPPSVLYTTADATSKTKAE